MNAQLSTFTFESYPIQVLIRDNEAWFIASEVACVFGYRDANKLTRILDDDEKDTHNVGTLGGKQNVSIINESGLYHAVLKSRKPEAKRFRKWVTSEVLPQIRKTGQYSTEYKTQPSDILTKEQQAEIRALVLSNAAKLPKEQRKVAIVQAWSKLKAHFKVPYRQIPQSEFSEAISIVQRTFTEWELVEDEHLPIIQNKDTFTLSRDQAYDVLCVFSMACFMNDTIRYLEKPLRLLGSSQAGTLYSQGVENRQLLLETSPLFEEMLSQFPPEGGKYNPIYGYTGNWDRLHHCVMPNVRQALK